MRIPTRAHLSAAALAILAAFSTTSPAGAQLAPASATTLGLSGNATATVRGFGALAVNPAALGMPETHFTLAVAPVQLLTGLNPITLKDLKDFQGKLVPASAKDGWLSRVDEAGGQSGAVGVQLTELAVTVGRVGLQVSTIASGSMSLAPDVAELMLYGNAGRTGTPTDLSLSGSTLDGFAVSTAGVSFGLPLPSNAADMALGATLKYSVGHVVAAGREQGGQVQSDPVEVAVDFPVVTFDDSGDAFRNGSGVGLDVGFQMKRDRLALGAAVLNAFNTFAWDADKLVYRPGTALLEQGASSTDFDTRPLSQAPASLRNVVDGMTFDPILSVGAGYDVGSDLTLTADVRNRFGDGMAVTPKLHAGAGAEYRGLPALELRGGAAAITGGFEVAGGASLILGPVNLSMAGALRSGDPGDTKVGQLTLSFGGR